MARGAVAPPKVLTRTDGQGRHRALSNELSPLQALKA